MPRHVVAGKPELSVTAHTWLSRGLIETGTPAPVSTLSPLSIGDSNGASYYENVVLLGGTGLMVTFLSWLAWIFFKHIYHFIKNNFPEADGECHKGIQEEGNESETSHVSSSKHHRSHKKDKTRSEQARNATTFCVDLESGSGDRACEETPLLSKKDTKKAAKAAKIARDAIITHETCEVGCSSSTRSESVGKEAVGFVKRLWKEGESMKKSFIGRDGAADIEANETGREGMGYEEGMIWGDNERKVW